MYAAGTMSSVNRISKKSGYHCLVRMWQRRNTQRETAETRFAPSLVEMHSRCLRSVLWCLVQISSPRPLSHWCLCCSESKQITAARGDLSLLCLLCIATFYWKWSSPAADCSLLAAISSNITTVFSEGPLSPVCSYFSIGKQRFHFKSFFGVKKVPESEFRHGPLNTGSRNASHRTSRTNKVKSSRRP